MKPEISVIVTCYNYGKYLGDCLASLVGGDSCLGVVPRQTFRGFEVIVVDDGSTDNTQDVALAFVKKHPQYVRYIYQPNKGTAAALNAGIRRAASPYIMPMCADDMLAPTHLSACHSYPIRRFPRTFVYTNQQFMSHGKLRKARLGKWDAKLQLYQNIVPCFIMYPIEAWREVGGYPEIMAHGREDWAFGVALAMHGWNGVLVEDSFSYYYRREGQGRTERNKPEDYNSQFLAQIQQLYPLAYLDKIPA